MRWSDQRQSDNVEDRRGQRAGFGGGRIGGMGIGGLLILMLFGYLIGGDPMALLRDAGQVSTGVESGPGAGAPSAPPTDEAGQFVRAVLGSTEDVWNACSSRWGAATPSRAWFCSPTACSRRAAWPRPRSGRSTARPISRSTST